MKLCNEAGATQDNAIAVDEVEVTEVVSGNNGVTTPSPAASISAQRAVEMQRSMLEMYNKNMYKKKAATVSPSDEGKKKRGLEDDSEENEVEEVKVSTIVTTKTIKDESGATTTVKMSRPVVAATTPAALRQSQSTLSVYGFCGGSASSPKVIPIYEA